MAKSIHVDPARLENAAQKMDSQVADYERLYKQLFSEVEGMGAAWQGADNLAFVGQIQGFRENFQQMATLMKQYSQFLKSSSNAYRSTQEEIITRAKRL